MLYWREIKHSRECVHGKVYKHQTQIWWWSCEHTWLPFPSLHTELFQNTRFSAASFSRVSGRMCKIFHNFSQGWSTWITAQCQGRCGVKWLRGWGAQHSLPALQPAQLWAQAHTPPPQKGIQLRQCCWAAKPTWELRTCPLSVRMNLTWTRGPGWL